MKTYLLLHKGDPQTSNATTFFLFRHIERRKDDAQIRQCSKFLFPYLTVKLDRLDELRSSRNL